MIRRFSWSRLVVLAAVVAIVAGCASPASREAMSVTGTPVTKKYPFTVGVKVAGGTEGSAAGGPTISDADMKAAIEASIQSSNLFKSVVAPSGAQYELAVFITKIDKPSIGFSFTVEMEAGWSLTRVADKSVAMKKVVTSTYTASVGDAVVGATRIRLAVEGAARNNIASGLRAIAALDL